MYAVDTVNLSRPLQRPPENYFPYLPDRELSFRLFCERLFAVAPQWGQRAKPFLAEPKTQFSFELTCL
jgi:hypothetical protein